MPVFDTAWEAREKTGCNATMIFVPPAGAADAILEAADAGIELIVCITEGHPRHRHDARARRHARQEGPAHRPELSRRHHARRVQIGIMPGYIHKPGKVGVVSRSGTLTYEAVWQLTSRGLGQSTCIGIGGDPINGTSHTDAVKMFNEDPDTDAIILIGEIGGTGEEDAATYIKENVKKPVAAFIAGATAPPGRRMGHAGGDHLRRQGHGRGQDRRAGRSGAWASPARRLRWPTR